MPEYKVLVTARSFGTADNKARELLEKNGCLVKKLDQKDGPIPDQLEKEDRKHLGEYTQKIILEMLEKNQTLV